MESRPLLIYDGDCGFCKRWVDRSKKWTADRVIYASSQEVGGNFPEITSDQFQKSIWLIDIDGKIYHSADAAFRVISYGQKFLFHSLYQRFPWFRTISEKIYVCVAKNRKLISVIDLFFLGQANEKTNTVVNFFHRGMGLIYLFAFVSLFFQLPGLIGNNGVLPVSNTLQAMKESGYGFFSCPTLLWIHPTDGFLRLICGAGVLSSVLIIFDVFPTLFLFLTWFFYLSLSVAGMDFLSFQWDALLLETGFLSIFLAWYPTSKIVLWLLRLLLFRLMFSSGIVKLMSGDEVWKNLTALDFHFETQPLPTWIGFYAQQLPSWIHKFCTLGMFFIEIVIPFFIFPAKTRKIACGFLVFLQAIILLTGNYAFFNWLTILLCVLLIDNHTIEKYIPLISAIENKSKKPMLFQPAWLPKFLAAGILFLSTFPLINLFGHPKQYVSWYAKAIGIFEPYRIVNGYGLFAVMTTTRREIVIEGSNDGSTWSPYEFKYKPGDVSIRPTFVAPHQPRLDWQMWFAALGTFEQNYWFQNLIIRLMQGSQEVESLFLKNPFPNHPPTQIRASLYEYHFVDLLTHRQDKVWWHRKYVGEYMSPVHR